jgi:DNA-binding transcriptional LysR family regulator
MMDIAQLSAFITVAEAGSFSQAAEQLNLTQPAVSKRIAVLENDLAVRLFDRIGKRVMLTEAGRLFLPRSRKIIREMEDVRTTIHNLSDQVSGTLSVGSSHHIGLHRLPPVLKQFSNIYPEVIIDISFLDSEKAYAGVNHGELELAVVTLSPKQEARIESQLVWNDPLSVMTSPDHALTNLKVIELSNLIDFPAILPAKNTFTRQLIDNMFNNEGLKMEPEMSTNYLETIKMIVSVGMAWSVLPESMLDENLKVLPIKNARLKRRLGYIYHRDHTLSNAASAFIEILREHAVD